MTLVVVHEIRNIGLEDRAGLPGVLLGREAPPSNAILTHSMGTTTTSAWVRLGARNRAAVTMTDQSFNNPPPLALRVDQRWRRWRENARRAIGQPTRPKKTLAEPKRLASSPNSARRLRRCRRGCRSLRKITASFWKNTCHSLGSFGAKEWPWRRSSFTLNNFDAVGPIRTQAADVKRRMRTHPTWEVEGISVTLAPQDREGPDEPRKQLTASEVADCVLWQSPGGQEDQSTRFEDGHVGTTGSICVLLLPVNSQSNCVSHKSVDRLAE
jgi:hypothetical protein